MIVDGIREALRLILQRDPSVVDASIRSLWISTAAVMAGVWQLYRLLNRIGPPSAVDGLCVAVSHAAG